ncbi:MAG: MFS transporter, partial [Ilumatobacteraceae bacterium]
MATALGVLRQQAVRRYLGSTAFAAIGINICITALFKQVYDITGDPFSIGLLGLAQFVPGLVLAIPSGYIADRFDRRHVTAGFLLLRLLSIAVLIGFTNSGSTAVSVLVLVAIGIGVADALITPSRRAILPLIVSTDDLPRVIALWTATFTSSAIVGPALAGFLYSIDPSIAYAAAGGSALLSVPLTLGIRYLPGVAPVADEGRPSVRLALQGLRFIRRSPIVLAAISLDLFAVLFGGAVALIPVVASDRLGVGDVAYGWLR